MAVPAAHVQYVPSSSTAGCRRPRRALMSHMYSASDKVYPGFDGTVMCGTVER